MEDYSINSRRTRVQIPAFGNWDYCDEMPITQYFDSAMLQYSAAGHHYFAAAAAAAADDHDHLFTVPTTTTTPHKTPHHHHIKARKGGGGERRMARREQQMRKQQGKVYDLTNNIQSPSTITTTTAAATATATATTTKPRAPKAVDEDLYKIPPELLYQIKPKKKRLLRNLWSGCLGLNCIA